MSYLFEVENLSVKYSSTVALHDVDFTVPHPTFLVIMGPNGSGKTTLLKTALGIIKPAKGSLKVMGIDPVRHSGKVRRLVRYVPQKEHIDYNIPVKVKDMVLMGSLLKKPPPRIVSKRDIDVAKKSLKSVGLEDLWNKPFLELSGGQKQRVLVARAISARGEIMFLDEPLSGADAESQFTILETLHDLRHNEDVSVVMVTHDLNPCHPYVDKALLLNRTVIAYGNACDLMQKDVLEKVYGPNTTIIEHEGHFYCITGDVHA